ncbi:MAG: hypothetical protein KIT84_28660 [Labilithrix sp.]|nr:hypothetical protein [Labilithrix sp.]MCW5815032.1 hypothetical protein [Labilithrix sp.]
MSPRLLFVLAFAVAGCGSAPPPPRPAVTERRVEPEPVKPSTIVTEKEEPKPEPWRPTESGGDAPVPYVRNERTSRLDALLPKGRGKEVWRTPLALADAPAVRATFVLAAGNRIAVTTADAWILFDTKGVRIAGRELESPYVRIDRASGAVVADDVRAPDLPADAKTAAKNGLVVLVKDGAVAVGERAIEGKFEAFDVAIDESSVASVVVKQGEELSLWTVPISSRGAIGRHKLGKGKRPIGPPVLGKNVRVVVFDTGVVAYALDGKKLWERKGAPSGGVSITIDDQVLVADQNKVVAVDRKGKATELWSAPDIVLATPPIINGEGLLLVASAELLHAISFT